MAADEAYGRWSAFVFLDLVEDARISCGLNESGGQNGS